jgi:hypothetical protein
VLLFLALARRLQSPGVAFAAMLVIVTASFDVALSAVIWTPPIASALAKGAVALVVMEWHRGAAWRLAIIVAWMERAAGLHQRCVRHGRRAGGADHRSVARRDGWPCVVRRW